MLRKFLIFFACMGSTVTYSYSATIEAFAVKSFVGDPLVLEALIAGDGELTLASDSEYVKQGHSVLPYAFTVKMLPTDDKSKRKLEIKTKEPIKDASIVLLLESSDGESFRLPVSLETKNKDNAKRNGEELEAKKKSNYKLAPDIVLGTTVKKVNDVVQTESINDESNVDNSDQKKSEVTDENKPNHLMTIILSVLGLLFVIFFLFRNQKKKEEKEMIEKSLSLHDNKTTNLMDDLEVEFDLDSLARDEKKVPPMSANDLEMEVIPEKDIELIETLEPEIETKLEENIGYKDESIKDDFELPAMGLTLDETEEVKPASEQNAFEIPEAEAEKISAKENDMDDNELDVSTMNLNLDEVEMTKQSENDVFEMPDMDLALEELDSIDTEMDISETADMDITLEEIDTVESSIEETSDQMPEMAMDLEEINTIDNSSEEMNVAMQKGNEIMETVASNVLPKVKNIVELKLAMAKAYLKENEFVAKDLLDEVVVSNKPELVAEAKQVLEVYNEDIPQAVLNLAKVKLELAQTYVNVDNQIAEPLLKEVIASGCFQQRRDASDLLDQLA